MPAAGIGDYGTVEIHECMNAAETLDKLAFAGFKKMISIDDKAGDAGVFDIFRIKRAHMGERRVREKSGEG